MNLQHKEVLSLNYLMPSQTISSTAQESVGSSYKEDVNFQDFDGTGGDKGENQSGKNGK